MEYIALGDDAGAADGTADEYTPELDAILDAIIALVAEGALTESPQ